MLSDEDWQRILDVNLLAAVRLDRAFLPGMIRNTGIFAYFAAKGGAVSLRFRLAGGAGSLALTILCPNSLLTGNLANSGALKPHFLSLSCTFQKETSVEA